MKKNLCLVVMVLAVLALLRGIPYVAAGISSHGITGANYGAVIFPVLLGAVAVYLYRKQE